MMNEGVAWKLGAKMGEVLEVDTNKNGKIWGDFMRVRVNHDVDEPLRSEIISHDWANNELFILEIKYERVPRFCGFLGHGQRDCKLSVDLQKRRYSATMHASPFKHTNSKGGYVDPVAGSARRFLSFG